jgi:hypothetical protein
MGLDLGIFKFICNLFKDDGLRYYRGSIWVDDKIFKERCKKMGFTSAQYSDYFFKKLKKKGGKGKGGKC